MNTYILSAIRCPALRGRKGPILVLISGYMTDLMIESDDLARPLARTITSAATGSPEKAAAWKQRSLEVLA